MRHLNMSTLSISMFLLFNFNCFPQKEVRFAAAIPSSSVASSQIDFWSEHVVNPMPEAIVSKLSPLSNQDSVLNSLLASSIATKESFNMNEFCSKANLACTPLPKSTLGLIKVSQDLIGYAVSLKNVDVYSNEKFVDSNYFFRLSSLVKGRRIKLSLEKIVLPPRSFLPSQIASKVATTNPTDLEKFFPDLFASQPMKQTIERSIRFCNSPAVKGEIKTCSNSLEDMIEFSKRAIGVEKLRALTTESSKGSGQELEIGDIKRINSEKIVSCHEIFFPFATYFCHLLSSSATRLYAIDFVEPETKVHVNKILALCHMDTSGWSPDDIAFKTLKISPGKGEVCHWYRNSKLGMVWISNNVGKRKL